MFNDLYDSISLWFSWRWPRVDGVITAVHNDSQSKNAGPMVVYEFSVGDDGPYAGESAWFGNMVYMNELVGRKITVRYREDDPSVNRLDDLTAL
jgi:hypothetical protein